MRLVVYDNFELGVLSDSGVHAISAVVPEPWRNSRFAMNYLVEHWDRLRSEVERIQRQSDPRPLDSVRLRPPVPVPLQLLAAPGNYHAHIAEMRGTTMAVQTDRKTPRDIGFFLKAPGSIVGPADAIEVPPLPGRRFDHESELALVIGREAKGVKRADAYDYVFGYTCLIDVTMRMTETQREERVMRKSFASFTPVGPVLMTADEIGRPDNLRVQLWVNDQLRQDANTRDLIVDIPELIEMASSVLPLSPGDLYSTGTPSGVGPLEVGDTVTIEIERVGRMSLPVRLRDW